MRRFAVLLLAVLVLALGLAYLALRNTSVALEGDSVNVTTGIAGGTCQKRLSAQFPFVSLTCESGTTTAPDP